MTADARHIPVLLEEVLTLLDPRPGEVYADCTAGLGGHAAAIARRLAPGGTVILNDVDPANLAVAEASVRAAAPDVKVLTFRGNFAELPRRLEDTALAADLVLADLGFASTQMDDPARGLSFMRDGPLDMRLDPSLAVSAADLVASLTEDELARIIQEFGEEPAARRIARKLVRARAAEPISTTARLAEIVRSALPPARGQAVDPATRTFQALRIAVNDEIGGLETLLFRISTAARAGGRSWLRPGARIGIIAFHSLEDRPVKRAFGELTAQARAAEVGDGVVRPSEEEVLRNPRSRSARLRVIRIASDSTSSHDPRAPRGLV